MSIDNKEQFTLGIDLEGIGLDSGPHLDVDRVMEIGAVLWDVQRKAPVQLFSHLINEADRLSINQELTELTGIDENMLQTWGVKGENITEKLHELTSLINKADYLMAHGAHFYDKPMLEALYKRFSLEMPKRTWIDSSEDIEFPGKIKHKSLASLEYAHGFINPFPHRAVTDALSMLKIASAYSLERMAQLAESPKVIIVATFKAPNWRDKREVTEFNKIKTRVSKAKFSWNPQEKIWTKKIHQLLIDENKIHFDFKWKFLKERP